jgi:hypothetical protein
MKETQIIENACSCMVVLMEQIWKLKFCAALFKRRRRSASRSLFEEFLPFTILVVHFETLAFRFKTTICLFFSN